MDILWTLLIISIIGVAQAVPCSDIGWENWSNINVKGSYDLKQAAKYPNPLESNGEWEIIKAKDAKMYVRFQVPRAGQTTKDARVTKTEFEITPEEVKWKMNNYQSHDDNIQLWLPFNSFGLAYGNVANLAGSSFPEIVPQANLNVQLTVMSIILPSGAAKLKTVNPDKETCDHQEKINVERAQSVGIGGLEGRIDSSDWAYTMGNEAKVAMDSVRRRQLAARPSKPTIRDWVLAEKQDGNCVVIEVTDMIDFTP